MIQQTLAIQPTVGFDCPGICTSEGQSAGPIPDTGISLGQTVCFGTCPEYTITTYPNEFYQLKAGQFTANPGQSTGTLSAGSFAAANAALQAANFNNLPTNITPGKCRLRQSGRHRSPDRDDFGDDHRRDTNRDLLSGLLPGGGQGCTRPTGF